MVIAVSKSEEVESGTRLPSLMGLILIAAAALFVRIDDLGYVTESLWAEDGNLMINQAKEIGVRSLWAPHAGYLFLYPRAIALLARPLPLGFIPCVFFLSWMMTFSLVVGILKSRAKSAGLNQLSIALLVCAIALQPSHGESFFNVNSANYMLGMALAFYVCIPVHKPVSALTIIFLVFASLSGPFSALMVVVLALQWVVLRDFSARRATYILVAVGGLIQSIILLGARRVGRAPTGASTAQWSDTLLTFLSFGGANKLSNVAAGILWAITATFLCRRFLQKSQVLDRNLWLSPVFAIVAAFLLFFSVVLNAWGGLTGLSPLDLGSRYFLIPYSLILFTAIECTQHNRAAYTVVIALISTICGASFLTVDRADRGGSTGLLTHANLQWVAFTKFREIKADLIIPINPLWPIYPPLWSVESDVVGAEGRLDAPARRPILLRAKQELTSASSSDVADVEWEASQSVYFDMKDNCARSSYVALEIDIWRSRMGLAKLYWGRAENFDSKRSLERFYPSGDAVMQFAFRRDPRDRLLRLDPMKGLPNSAVVRQLSEWKIYIAQTGRTIGEPTEPGGEMRMGEARLYCLE